MQLSGETHYQNTFSSLLGTHNESLYKPNENSKAGFVQLFYQAISTSMKTLKSVMLNFSALKQQAIVCTPCLRNQQSWGTAVAWLLCDFRPKAQQRLINQSIYHMCKKRLPASFSAGKIGIHHGLCGGAFPTHWGSGSSDELGAWNTFWWSHTRATERDYLQQWHSAMCHYTNGALSPIGLPMAVITCCNLIKPFATKKQTSGIREVILPISLHYNA